MRRTFAITLCIVAAAALFVGLVHIVLVAAHLSEPAANTVHGLTIRRLWATAASLLALVAAVGGGISLARAFNRSHANSTRRFAFSALIAGSVAAAAGWLNLAYARGGPGTGNGVVGGAAAFVLGLVAVALGAIALARFRRTALNPRQTT
ncbi:DUF6223 family protein [Occallatibacter riparius]|uniref:DUF6223 family protein n=1 Tax=Occallatibacter riparius TaxID=1002689 RepID=A0A9J7BWP6_9BACT|nr:DUF6223 family protein [Occallatibacter riparius]UWZ86905.1 DUF6223 family protein [Occallatibacter riparius]